MTEQAVTIVGYSHVFQLGGGSSSTNGVESVPVMTITVPVVYGELYRVKAGGMRLRTTVAGDSGELRLKSDDGTSQPVRLQACPTGKIQAGGAGATDVSVEGYYAGQLTGDVTFNIVMTRVAGTGVMSVEQGNGTAFLTVEHLGTAPSS